MRRERAREETARGERGEKMFESTREQESKEEESQLSNLSRSRRRGRARARVKESENVNSPTCSLSISQRNLGRYFIVQTSSRCRVPFLPPV